MCFSCTLLYTFLIEGSMLVETATKGQFHMHSVVCMLPRKDMAFVLSCFP